MGGLSIVKHCDQSVRPQLDVAFSDIGSLQLTRRVERGELDPGPYMHLTLTYGLLALIATVVNIASQDVCNRVYVGDFNVQISVAVGTLAGLVAKYWLDKRYIFRFKARNAMHDGLTFALYTLMGCATTVIFWATEFGFDWWFQTKEMRYLGGVLGLGIGYLVKYQLDKRFVFTHDMKPVGNGI
jgi:putative flippase GtrA